MDERSGRKKEKEGSNGEVVRKRNCCQEGKEGKRNDGRGRKSGSKNDRRGSKRRKRMIGEEIREGIE